MSTPADMAERHSRILAELAELGMSLTRALHEKAMAAETPQEMRDLGLAVHRISRSVRQTLALEARLERDRLRLARETREERGEAERQRADGLPQRKARVRAAVERLIWTEGEEGEIDQLLCDLDEVLDAAALTDDFVLGPIEAQVERLRAELGLLKTAAPRAPAAAPAFSDPASARSASPPRWRPPPEARPPPRPGRTPPTP